MWHKKLRFILLFIFLSVTFGCQGLGILDNMGRGRPQGQDNNIFNEGKTYIRLEEKSTKGASKASFDHPKYLKKDILSTLLSSIYYKEKGITGWGKEQNIFRESELLNLTPHMVDAFTKASPSQYILVNSSYTKGKGFFKTEVYTIFGLFVSNNKLNVVFSRIQYDDLTGKNAEKTIFAGEEEPVFVDPFSITRNPFWSIIPRSGQQFKAGHGNWLIIDLEEGAFVSKEDYGKEVALGKKQEDVNLPGATQTVSGGQPVIVQQMSITDQLLELKELETTGLITKEDYELRKTLILGSKKEKSIKDKFNDLRKLKEGGLISDIDYDHKKRDLLEEGDQSEKGKNIKEILAVYLELRDEGYITDEDYDYKKKKLLKEF